MAKPPPVAVELSLRDGTPVVIRPITPEDKARLREGLRRLSEGSRYRRFMAPVADLSDEGLRYLTEIDYRDHMAWIACDPTAPGQPGLGVARYVRVPKEPTVAEAAVAVVDSHQGRGLGTLLLGALALFATENGVRTFRAYVLEANRPVLEMLRDLGATVTREGSGVLRVEARIAERPDDLPDTPTGRVFKAVARELVPPLSMRGSGPGPRGAGSSGPRDVGPSPR